MGKVVGARIIGSVSPGSGQEYDRPWYEDAYEIGRQAAGGVVVDIPRAVGMGLRKLGGDTGSLAASGRRMVESAAARAPDWEPNSVGEGYVAGTLSRGARGIGMAVPVIAASIANPYLGASAAASLYGLSSAQETEDKLRLQGVPDAAARTAGNMTGMVQGVGEAAASLFFGKMLTALRPAKDMKSFVGNATNSSVLKPFAKAYGANLAVQPATEVAQDLATESIERGFGATPEDMGRIAEESARGGLGMAALLGPFGYAGARSRGKRAELLSQALTNPNAPPEIHRAAVEAVSKAAESYGVPVEEVADWVSRQTPAPSAPDLTARTLGRAPSQNLENVGEYEQLFNALKERAQIEREYDLLSPPDAYVPPKEVRAGTLPQRGLALPTATPQQDPTPVQTADPALENVGEYEQMLGQVGQRAQIEREYDLLADNAPYAEQALDIEQGLSPQRGLFNYYEQQQAPAPVGTNPLEQGNVRDTQTMDMFAANPESMVRTQFNPLQDPAAQESPGSKYPSASEPRTAVPSNIRSRINQMTGQSGSAFTTRLAIDFSRAMDSRTLPQFLAGVETEVQTSLDRLNKRLDRGDQKLTEEDYLAARAKLENNLASIKAARTLQTEMLKQEAEPRRTPEARTVTPVEVESTGTEQQIREKNAAQTAVEGTAKTEESGQIRMFTPGETSVPRGGTRAARRLSLDKTPVAAEGKAPRQGKLFTVKGTPTVEATRAPKETNAGRTSDATVEPPGSGGVSGAKSERSVDARGSDAPTAVAGPNTADGVVTDAATAESVRTPEAKADAPSIKEDAKEAASMLKKLDMHAAEADKAKSQTKLDDEITNIYRIFRGTKLDVVRERAREILDDGFSAKDLARAERRVKREVDGNFRTKKGDADGKVDVDAVVKESNLSSDVDVQVVDKPEDVKGLGKAPPGATGAMLDGKIYLFRSGLTSKEEVEKTLFHELLHLALARAHKGETDRSRAIMKFLADPDVRAKAKEWKESADGALRRKELSAASFETLAVEEALADISENINSGDKVGTKNTVIARMARTMASVADAFGMKGLAARLRDATYTGTEQFVRDTLRIVQRNARPAVPISARGRFAGTLPADAALTDMPISDFLSVAKSDGPSEQQMSRVQQVMGENGSFSTFPTLTEQDGNVEATGVTRAQALGKAGYTHMPVVVKGTPKFRSARKVDTSWMSTPPSSMPGLKKMFDAVMDKANWRSNPWTLGMMTNYQLGDTFSFASNIADKVSDMAAAAKRLMAQSHEIDRAWAKLDQKSSDELSRLMLETSMEKLYILKPGSDINDPVYVGLGVDTLNKHLGDNPPAATVLKHKELTERMKKATPEMRRIYLDTQEKMRSDWQRWSELIERALIRSYESTLGAALGAGRSGDTLRDLFKGKNLLAIANMTSKQQKEARENDLYKLLSANTRENLRNLWSDVEAVRTDTSKLEGPYFPLVRFGKYVVAYKSANLREEQKNLDILTKEYQELLAIEPATADIAAELQDKIDTSRAEVSKQKNIVDKLKASEDDYTVEFYESRADAIRAHDEARAELKKKGLSDKEIEESAYWQLRTEHMAKDESASPVFMRRLEESLASKLPTRDAAAIKNSIRDIYIRSMPERSAMKSQLRRIGVAGVKSSEMRRAFAYATLRNAWRLSRLEYGADINESISDLRNSSAEDKKLVAGEFGRRMVHAMQFDEGNALADTAANLGYVWHLGLSPSFLITNMLQPWIVSAPVMASKFGAPASVSALSKASGDVLKHMKMQLGKKEENVLHFEIDVNAFKGPGEAAMLNNEFVHGRIDVTLEHDVGATAAGASETLFGKVMKFSALPAHHTEVYNRVSTALATYRLARAKGLSEDAARNAVKEVLNDTHLDYTPENAARLMRPSSLGGFGRVVFQFKKYSQGMVYLLAKNGYRAVKGDKESAKALSYILGLQIAVAGTSGLPILPVLSLVALAASQFWDDDDEPEIMEMLYTGVKDAGGEFFARAVAKGLPAAILNTDISGQVGMGGVANPFAFANLGNREGADFVAHATLALFGPAGSLAARWADAMVVAGEQGDYLKAVGMSIPKVLANGIQAYELADKGLTTRKGDILIDPEEIGGLGVARRALGFQSTDATDTFDRRAAFYAMKGRRDEVRSQLIRDMAKAKPGETEGLLEDIQGFNKRNPEYKITAKDWIARRRNEKKKAEEMRSGLRVTKRDVGIAEELGVREE